MQPDPNGLLTNILEVLRLHRTETLPSLTKQEWWNLIEARMAILTHMMGSHQPTTLGGFMFLGGGSTRQYSPMARNELHALKEDVATIRPDRRQYLALRGAFGLIASLRTSKTDSIMDAPDDTRTCAGRIHHLWGATPEGFVAVVVESEPKALEHGNYQQAVSVIVELVPNGYELMQRFKVRNAPGAATRCDQTHPKDVFNTLGEAITACAKSAQEHAVLAAGYAHAVGSENVILKDVARICK